MSWRQLLVSTLIIVSCANFDLVNCDSVFAILSAASSLRRKATWPGPTGRLTLFVCQVESEAFAGVVGDTDDKDRDLVAGHYLEWCENLPGAWAGNEVALSQGGEYVAVDIARPADNASWTCRLCRRRHDSLHPG